MTKAKKIGGIIVPFDANGDLAVEKARSLIEKHLDICVHGFYVGGSSGEGFFQSVEERCDFMRFVAEVVSDRGLLIARLVCCLRVMCTCSQILQFSPVRYTRLMAESNLIRQARASFGTVDYDRLSPLGHGCGLGLMMTSGLSDPLKVH